ncbi:MAG: hypothetical protein II605_01920 [Paludibacteraceae bacterium]|nr:hypothetical protein [Paludibacteraceae bacterium]MBQ2189975.1 hypothetical protein [Paludibacteraceae bacterium]MBQ2520080.1 hypothetical protein [Paludibacteraceae bacterium]MBQ4017981.1 hypothetical protein [Paludibacteraceae bacterium]MBQ5378951.1 hypothetical protein [Paludibacteraceae bacterium]
MKKQFYFFLALVLIGLASCTYPTYTTVEGETCKFNKKSIYLTVKQNEWNFDNDAKQFYAHFDLPELTAAIYNYGNYSLHREYNTDTDKAYQVALPQSTFCVEEVDDGNGGTEYVYYTQMVDYRVGIGYVEVQVTNSDYFYSATNPEAMTFHLQLIY